MTADHLGSPRVITDQNGAVTKRQDYAAFGDETTTAQRTSGLKYTNPDELRKGYTGYEKDEESGLDFAQARYYNSTHGRFTSVDPLTASASIKNPQTFNRYSYVLNSPYKFVDPLGLISENTGACGGRCGNGMYGGRMGIGLYSDSGVGQTIQIGHEQHAEAPAAPPPASEDPPIPMTDAVRAQVTNPGVNFVDFTIVTTEIVTGIVREILSVGAASTQLTTDLTAMLGTQGDIFFDRGVQEKAKFNAAITAMKGLIANLTAQDTTGIKDGGVIVEYLQKTVKNAQLGVPIAEISGIGIGIGPVSASTQRETNDAVSAYNSYLAETNALKDTGSARFSRAADSAVLTIKYTPTIPVGSPAVERKMPLKAITTQTLFSDRMEIARIAGQQYLRK